ncbi:MAG: methyltransferase domain-containing protein [Anaerolineales bacterium]|nr:methyltransferase domain-containing protein [Anaerolineales bacterium]
MDLSVIILSFHKQKSLLEIINRIVQALPDDIQYELLVYDGTSIQAITQSEMTESLLNILHPGSGYGRVLKECFKRAQGDHVITLDSDLDQAPLIIHKLWQNRNTAQVVIASNTENVNYQVKKSDRINGSNLVRKFANKFLSLPVKDFSSGFRLYQKRVLEGLKLSGEEEDILPEILIQSHANGWHIHQVAINLEPHYSRESRLFKLNLDTVSNLFRMWQLRNSIDSADYDERAYYSKIPFQRFWQRERYKIITRMASKSNSILDIGCGSSRILHDLDNIFGLDIKANKLRYMKRYDKDLVHGTIFTLPFTSESFDCVICSEVIEHIPFDNSIFSEMYRVLRIGGTLIIGTPDYGSINWPIIEAVYQRVIPNGYADEHVTHYTLRSLENLLEDNSFHLVEFDSILNAEIILRLLKHK